VRRFLSYLSVALFAAYGTPPAIAQDAEQTYSQVLSALKGNDPKGLALFEGNIIGLNDEPISAAQLLELLKGCRVREATPPSAGDPTADVAFRCSNAKQRATPPCGDGHYGVLMILDQHRRLLMYEGRISSAACPSLPVYIPPPIANPSNG
jgi:hypothetical protein